MNLSSVCLLGHPLPQIQFSGREGEDTWAEAKALALNSFKIAGLACLHLSVTGGV